MIYLDNAATTFPKPKCVTDATVECIRHYCGNPGRSAHSLSVASAEKVFECREAIAALTGFPHPERICFVQNATHALNIAIKGVVTEKCHCIISDIEHNSVIRPLSKIMNKYDGEISVFDSDKPVTEAVIPLIRDDTKAIVVSWASNVTGKSIDVCMLGEIAHKAGVKLIIDASQYIGHKPINLSGFKWDILCAPGHKALFGLQGSGFIIFKSSTDIDTLIEGGSGTDSLSENMPILVPERFEAGTLAVPSIVGLKAGIDFILEYGIYNVERRINQLTSMLLEILSQFDRIKVYGCNNGIASFNVDGIGANIVASYLDEHNICVRSGLHCSPLIHKKLGTVDTGSVRASLSILNNEKELERFESIIKKLL